MCAANTPSAWEEALAPVLSEPATLVLRDFHVDNLMRLPGRSGLAACGLLDFQDAVAGPAAYDLMSLLEDARRDVSPALKAEMLARYRCGVGEADWGGFQRTFDVLAAQRHAKVIGIFTRLCQRDGKSGYLVHIPRVWRLLEQALASASLAQVARWFDRHLPRSARVIPSPAESRGVETVQRAASADARPRQAMVLAAGLGLRMRPITERLPKTLIEIGGRSMLDRAIDGLEAVGVEQVVVNAYHLAPLIERHLARRRSPPIRLCVEAALLETGGGVANALPLLGRGPFYIVNGDVLWRDGPAPTLADLAAAWDDRRMDGLLLLHPVETAIGYAGPGDFLLGEDGRLARRQAAGRAPFLFAGMQILHSRLFAEAPTGAFSLNVLYDRAIAAGKLFGVVHRGGWCHVGTPADIPVAEAFLRRSGGTG